MTSPITPYPALHHDPSARQDFLAQLSAEERALQRMFSSIIPTIFNELLKMLTGGLLGAGNFENNQITNLFTNLFHMLGISDPASILAEVETGVFNAETQVAQFVDSLIKPLARFLNMSDWNAFLTQLFNTPEQVISNIAHVVIDTANADIAGLLNALHNAFSGGSGTGATVSGVGSSATAVKTKTDNIATNVYNGWYGSGGTGDATQVTTAIAAIKTTIQGGYTVETLTASGNWTQPTGNILDFWAICIGSGDGGGSGSNMPGGNPGNYVAQQINPSSLPGAGLTVSYTIAAGGAGSTTNGTSGAPGGDSSFGSLASSAGSSTASIASLFGFYDATVSAPGKGGTGGSTSGTSSGVTSGTAGGSTPLAAGGTGGARNLSGSGTAGGAGGTASTTGQTRAGGGGGGGGGGAYTIGSGGAGGAGGFPGGGGGSGGGGPTAGHGGNGGNGCIILLYRIAS